MAMSKYNNTQKNRMLSRLPFFRNSSKNDENIDRIKKKSNSNNKNNLSSIDEIFLNVLNELQEYVIGQTEYTEKLCMAFQRPYLYDNGKSYANMGIVLGPNGSGRYYAIKVLTTLLYHKKLLKNADIYNLDFTNYEVDSVAEKLLFPDLYKALYGHAEVIVINNFDRGCSKATETIISLGVNGVIKTNKRFNWNRGDLQEISGTYSLGTINSLNANGKYIFLLSNQDASYLSQNYPVSFLEEINDIMSTSELDDDSLKEIFSSFLNDMKDKIQENMDIQIEYDSIIDKAVKKADKAQGAYGLLLLANKKIYSTIADLVLEDKLQRNTHISLQIENNYLVAGNFIIAELGKTLDENLVQEIKKELSKVIGLSNVKTFLEGLELQIRFENETNQNKQAEISKHMIFCGNPGTGKTTIARLTSKYLKALGCLSSGHMIEVTRNDLIGQYVGETAQKTSSIIKKALGGILFIDEAYSIARGKDDIYGIEAVDTLVKYMEDYRNDLVVILAGYTKEMEAFLKTNSGLKSRFSHIIEFQDYTDDELLKITIEIANRKGYKIAQDCEGILKKYYSSQKKIMEQEFGNGRMVRNIIENAILHHSKRVMGIGKFLDSDKQLTLQLEDFEIEIDNNQNVINENELAVIKKELNEIVGLNKVKGFLFSLEAQIRFEKKCLIQNSTYVSRHMIFCGNPGTGKTTIARLTAKFLKALGCLSSGHLVEVSRNNLVGQYVGETAQKTVSLIKQAYGGILFIDEAYSLARGSDDRFGTEAIDTLVKYMEDYRENLIVILAGYSKEMETFLEANSGLKSRFNYKVEFEDYEPKELLEIATKIATKKSYTIDSLCHNSLLNYFQNEKNKKDWGNARAARNIVEAAILAHSSRVMEANEKIPDNELLVLTKEDFGLKDESINKEFNLEQEFEQTIGMDDVKNFIRSLYSFVKLNQVRKEMGLPTDETQTLHMIFVGNPGTGKTTMARIVGKMLFSMGILKTDKVIETDKSGLVAGYVGQTAIKTKEIIQSALDGVLFIDEAYSLSENTDSNNDFGHEAIEILLKDMDDYRDRLVVILAGYENHMKLFLNQNPGLASRFPNIINFQDYTSEELCKISKSILKNKGYILEKDAELFLNNLYERAKNDNNFGNGRYARNICEQAIRNLSMRVSKYGQFTPELLSTITLEDIEAIKMIH